MKQDMKIIKLILQILAENEHSFMPLELLAQQVQKAINANVPFNDKFIGHFFLAQDTNLIAELGPCFFVGQQYKSPTPATNAKVRITAQGLEFLEALKNDTIFHKVKDFSIKVAAEIGKELLSSVIKNSLGIG